MLGPGDFVGEGCLLGLPSRVSTATAIMMRILHREHAFSDHFISHILSRNSRVAEDLIDQLFNPNEKRLARALLQLARYGEQDRPQKQIPEVSQEVLAEMIGATRPRVNVFMNKFRKLGFIEYGDRLRGLQINKSRLSVVLHH
jgi:CRP-like cAMP-binding protein